MGERAITHSVPFQESVAEHQVHCFDKLAVPCILIDLGNCKINT